MQRAAGLTLAAALLVNLVAPTGVTRAAPIVARETLGPGVIAPASAGAPVTSPAVTSFASTAPSPTNALIVSFDLTFDVDVLPLPAKE